MRSLASAAESAAASVRNFDPNQEHPRSSAAAAAITSNLSINLPGNQVIVGIACLLAGRKAEACSSPTGRTPMR